MQSPEKIKVSDLNSLLTCVLCEGYYIDATTIIECLHSFCRTCIVGYLESNKYCPTCEVQVHKTRPLVNIRSDQTLQDIVYKLVPNLFKNEMKRRRDFYSQQCIAPEDIPSSSEKRGDVWGCDRLIFAPEDFVGVSLEYYPLNEPLPLKLQTNVNSLESLFANGSSHNECHRRYFRCPGALKVYHLKKMLHAKHNLQSNKKIDILYMHDYLKDQHTLVDLAYIYSWKRSEPLRLFFKVAQEPKLNYEDHSKPVWTLSDAQAIPSLKANEASMCTTNRLDSPTPSVAMAPSSSSCHSLRPPSPKMAEEPKEIRLEKPNCASMQSLQNSKARQNVISNFKLKSALKKPVHIPNLREHATSLQSAETLKRDYPSEIDIASLQVNDPISQPNIPSTKKKRVTFSEDLVQDCNSVQLGQSLSRFNNRSPLGLKSVNSSLRNIVNMRDMKNRMLSNQSS